MMELKLLDLGFVRSKFGYFAKRLDEESETFLHCYISNENYISCLIGDKDLNYYSNVWNTFKTVEEINQLYKLLSGKN